MVYKIPKSEKSDGIEIEYCTEFQQILFSKDGSVFSMNLDESGNPRMSVCKVKNRNIYGSQIPNFAEMQTISEILSSENNSIKYRGFYSSEESYLETKASILSHIEKTKGKFENSHAIRYCYNNGFNQESIGHLEFIKDGTSYTVPFGMNYTDASMSLSAQSPIISSKAGIRTAERKDLEIIKDVLFRDNLQFAVEQSEDSKVQGEDIINTFRRFTLEYLESKLSQPNPNSHTKIHIQTFKLSSN